MSDFGAAHAAFSEGEAAALDPDNASAAATGPALTTLRSAWLHLRCQICRHTFRAGDPVEVEPGGRALHASALLPCAGSGAEASANPEAGAFFAGLDEAWPPPAGLHVVRLDAGHSLVAPPHHGFQRHTCAVCGHTFRPQDHVILCPCFPSAPRCQAAIHLDPVHGLHCYKDWNPGAHRLHCPATSREIDE